MKYENIKIVHIIDGIDIKYNGNEENIETVFSFDKSNNFIQNFTYPVTIYSELIYNILNDKPIIKIEQPSFLFYSFQYQVSFAHYCTQCLPKLKEYMLKYKDYMLVIPISTYTDFVKEILMYCDISDDKILLLEDSIVYIFNELYTKEHIGADWSGPGTINTEGLFVYNYIRDKLNIKENKNSNRKIYIKKDGLKSDVGMIRKIVNEDEIINYLESVGFEIYFLGDKTILERKEILENADVIITQLGANCINFIFSNSPKNIILLSSNTPIGENFYVEQCELLNNLIINKKILYYNCLDVNADPKNRWNSPFKVELNDIIKLLKEMNIE